MVVSKEDFAGERSSDHEAQKHVMRAIRSPEEVAGGSRW